MSALPEFSFAKQAKATKGVLVIPVLEDAALAPIAKELEIDVDTGRAATAANFTGKARQSMAMLAPAGSKLDKLVFFGLGKTDDFSEITFRKFGGALAGKQGKASNILVDFGFAGDDETIGAPHLAAFAQGWYLRSYAFKKYKTKKKDDEKPKSSKVQIVGANAMDAKKHWASDQGVADGVLLARDLVNEPANALGPVEFAEIASDLTKLGVEVEVLGEKEMEKLGMGALLGVAQGSVRPPRMAIMKWNGGATKDQPVAFVGKGVVFDTGGISIKPSGGMEDMKGDMGGAAAVTGLMHALASRKAKCNVVGIIGLVENMPDGNAQRPGDIVTSMSGQTIEIINTDAEGRLVLADALWYCKETFKPKFMINLATLTGAILVALGSHHAGIFSNNDELAEKLTGAGKSSDEKVWRLPLGVEYDKMIDSKFADMKNTGGRWAGSITAAQFLQRYVDDVPWVHIDVAGTAMSSPSTDINTSWGSGFGVRLLDQLVRDHYES
ncbi:MAG: leucyl aminopeptidase [Pseudomonadota bacterium]